MRSRFPHRPTDRASERTTATRIGYAPYQRKSIVNEPLVLSHTWRTSESTALDTTATVAATRLKNRGNRVARSTRFVRLRVPCSPHYRRTTRSYGYCALSKIARSAPKSGVKSARPKRSTAVFRPIQLYNPPPRVITCVFANFFTIIDARLVSLTDPVFPTFSSNRTRTRLDDIHSSEERIL